MIEWKSILPLTHLQFSALLICFASFAQAGLEDRTFEQQRLEVVKITETILLENGICLSKIDCQRKQVVFVSPARSGIAIQVYGVSNNKTVIDQIVSACSKVFLASDGNMKITIQVFSITKQEDLARYFWQAKTPHLVIEFKGEK